MKKENLEAGKEAIEEAAKADAIESYPLPDDKMPEMTIYILRNAHKIGFVRGANWQAKQATPVKRDEKKIKIELLWELIEDFQDAREGDDIHAPKFSYNDIECELYEKMEDVDPNPPPLQ